MNREHRNIFIVFQVIFLLAVISFCGSGCSLSGLPPRAVPATVGGLGSQAILDLYAQYDTLINDKSLTPDAKTFLEEKVAPVLDKAKYEQIKYNKMVIKWMEENPQGDIPQEVTSQRNRYLATVAEINALFLSAQTNYMKKKGKDK